MIPFLFGFNCILRKPKNMPKKLLEKKFSLDKLTKKQFKFLRISIYTLGLFIVLGFITFHVLQIEVKTFKDLQLEQKDDYIIIQYFSQGDHSLVNLSVKLTDEEFKEIDENQIEVKVIKTLSPLLRKRGNVIVEESELKKRLFKKNETSVPNGTLVSSFFSTFYIEQGDLRKISDDKIKNFFKTPTYEVSSIKRTELKKLQPETPLDFDDLKKDSKFPKDLTVESDGKFYITGANTIHPIFSRKLLEKISPNFSFISGKLPKERNMERMNCSKNHKSNELLCSVNLELLEDEKMNVYHFIAKDISLEGIIEPELSFEIEKTISNYWARLKNLFW